MKLIYFNDDYKHEKIPQLTDPYDLSLCHTVGYRNSRNRVLVIIEFVSSGDLTEGGLLKDEVTRTTYENVLKYTQEYANYFGGKVKPEYAFVNFNNIKSYHLSKELQSTADNMFKERVDYWIDQLEPDVIFIFGSRCTKKLIGKNKVCELNLMHHYRGWKFYIKKIPTYFTIPIDDAFTARQGKEDLSDDAVTSANLLGYAAQRLAMAFIPTSEKRKLIIKSDVKYKLIDNIKSFDKFFKKLLKAQYVSYDIETTDLSTLGNTVLLTQFCLNTEPDIAYEIPIHHKDTPFSKADLKYIRKKLKKFFSRKKEYAGDDTVFLIGQNIGFDLRVTQHWLNVPYIYYCVWDIQAGEFLLDENKKGIKKYNTGVGGHYGLANVCCHYGNNFYHTSEFGKEDRTNIANTPLDEPLLMYGAGDVIFPMRIIDVQQYIASKLPSKSGTYLEEYKRMCLVQQSQMIKVQSTMKHRGTCVNHEYLTIISQDDGPVEQRLQELHKELLQDKDVLKANAVLLKQKNLPTTGLFGNVKTVIDLSKKAHKHILFEDVLHLEPLAYSKKTGDPKYDKYFLLEYKDTCPCTGLMQRISQLSTIKSSFIKPFIQKLENDLDSMVDQRIRPNFGYTDVVTGRSNSSNPSLQQIPEHSSDANIVKEMFIIPKGHLHYEADYSAHEVRNLGILAHDNNLAVTFKKIHNYLLKLRKKPTADLYANRKKNADPHRLNFQMFAGKNAADVTDDERQQAKGITFGTVYGMSAKSLSGNINKTLDETIKIMDSFFGKFYMAKKWLDNQIKKSKKLWHIQSPLGRRRNLYCLMSGNSTIVAAGERRAMNSEIQGFSSDLGFMAADLYAKAKYECLTELGEYDTTLPSGPNCAIHDSLKCEDKFEHVFLGLHLLEWAMTNGVKDFLSNIYGFDINVCYEVEAALSGTSWAKKYTWIGPVAKPDYETGEEDDNCSLETCIKNALRDHQQLYPGVVKNVDKTYKAMRKAYKKQCEVLNLSKKYPLNTRKEII